jgi:nucleotide-binding universal stress UspA family protein
MLKILVPVDFSETSTNALFYAINLFKGSEFEITLLHTFKMSHNAFYMKSMDRVLQEQGEREMEGLLKLVTQEEPDIRLQTKIINSDAVTAITSLGNSGDYDYIVMGTKGASGLKEVFVGSVAGGVISRTEAAVLVVPDSYEYRPLKEIAMALSGMPFSSPSVVEPLRKLVQMHASRIHVLHIKEEHDENFDEVLSAIKDLDHDVTYNSNMGHVNEGINEYLAKDDVELLCMVRSRKGFFQRMFNGSATMKQTFSSTVPLLILHN